MLPKTPRIGKVLCGLTTKVHLTADSRCRPVSRAVSSGRRHDVIGFGPVMANIWIRRSGPGRPRTRPGRLLADKAYCSREIRVECRRRGIKALIQFGVGHAEMIRTDRVTRLLRERERMPCRIPLPGRGFLQPEQL